MLRSAPIRSVLRHTAVAVVVLPRRASGRPLNPFQSTLTRALVLSGQAAFRVPLLDGSVSYLCPRILRVFAVSASLGSL